MNEYIKPLEELSEETKEYVNLRIDETKLKSVKLLATSLSDVFSWFLIISIFSVILLLIAIGLSLLIGSFLESLSLGFFIVSLFYILLALLLIIFRKKIFLNSFIRTFVKIFFN